MAIGYSFYFYFWIRLRIFWIPAFLYFSAIPASPLFSFSCFSVFWLHIYNYIYISTTMILNMCSWNLAQASTGDSRYWRRLHGR